MYLPFNIGITPQSLDYLSQHSVLDNSRALSALQLKALRTFGPDAIDI